MLTQEQLKSLLSYNSLTGTFTWLKKSNPKSNIQVGSVAGCVGPDGYTRICINRRQYRGHQLASLYMLGEIKQLDHVNTNRSDNRWSNLREASQSENVANTSISSRNTTGVKGVTLDKVSGLYIAQLVVNTKRYRRCFKALDEASVWIREIREALHKDYCNHG